MTHDDLLERVTEAMEDTYDVGGTTKQLAQAAMNTIAKYCEQCAKAFKGLDEWDAEDAYIKLAETLRE